MQCLRFPRQGNHVGITPTMYSNRIEFYKGCDYNNIFATRNMMLKQLPLRTINLIIGFYLLGAGICYAATAAPSTNLTPEQELTKNGYYVVKTHDTLYSIAWEFGLDYRVIAAMNDLSAPYALKSNQKLLLVEPGHTSPSGLGNPPIIVKHLSQYPTATTTTAITTINTSTLNWIWPTTGKIIKNYSLNNENLNKGIDINGKLGQSVVAASGGEVVYSGSGIPGYGNLIILKHNDHYLTAYADNERNLVKEGSIVKSGQPIAYMGQNSAHQTVLHFEIRYDGKPVNPISYLPKQ